MKAAVICLALVACASTSHTESTLKAALAVTQGAEAAFVLYDARHQADIVTTAQTRAEGVVSLAAYRDARSQVLLGFASAYKAIAVGALAKDGKTLDALSLAAAALEADLRAIGVKL